MQGHVLSNNVWYGEGGEGGKEGDDTWGLIVSEIEREKVLGHFCPYECTLLFVYLCVGPNML